MDEIEKLYKHTYFQKEGKLNISVDFHCYDV